MGDAKASPSPARAAVQAAKGPAGDVATSTRRQLGGGKAWQDFRRAVLLAEEAGATSVRKQGNTITMVFAKARSVPVNGAASPSAAEKQPNAAARRAERRREAARMRESRGVPAGQAEQAPKAAGQAASAGRLRSSHDGLPTNVETAARAVAESARAAKGRARRSDSGVQAL